MARRREHPLVLEVPALPWLESWRARAGGDIDLGTVPDAALDEWAGLDAVWLMGVWARSPASRAAALAEPGLRRAFDEALPGWTEADVAGSPYAVLRYEVDARLGGEAALARLRERIAARGLRLLLDFVPNHLAVDHPWTRDHPERFVPAEHGGFEGGGGRRLAHGRDPNFPPWTDTAQLDLRRPDTRAALAAELLRVAERCDGVRCDMAMLVLADVFTATWGGRWEGDEFWPEAIAAVRADRPDFWFLAEVYWGLEGRLVEQGFDWAYDKSLLDHLAAADARAVREHVARHEGMAGRLARFVENHDERRARDRMADPLARASSALALTLPGMRLLHDGQREGRRRRAPVQLARVAPEPVDAATEDFYRRLLAALASPVLRGGTWRPLYARPEWAANPTWRHFVAHRWRRWDADERWVCVANLSDAPAQCFLPLEMPELAGGRWLLDDVLHDVRYERDGDDLVRRGLYLDVPAWGLHLFRVTPSGR